MLHNLAIVIAIFLIPACGSDDQGNTRTTYMGPSGGANNGKKLPENDSNGAASGSSSGASTGSGAGGTTPGTTSTGSFQQGSLTGEWLGTCSASFINSFDFRGTVFTQKSKLYDNATCGTQQAEIITNGDFKTGNAHFAGFELDLTLVQHRMTMLTTTAAASANSRKTCGFTDWQMGVEKAVNAGDCDSVAKSSKIETIYGLNGSDLHLGTSIDITGWYIPTSRSTGFSADTYKKQ